MEKEIRWSEQAEITFFEVVEYLNQNWTQKEVDNFIDETYSVIELISKKPLLSRSSGLENYREILITKHNLLMYRIREEEIVLLSFFDTRQHPRKKPKAK